MKWGSSQILSAVAVGLLCLPSPLRAQAGPERTLELATIVLDEAMAVPAKRIPQSLLSEAEGVAIIPNVVKGGFVVGVRHGRGVVMVRNETRNWSPPMFATLTGGSVGWQAGLQATDVILLFMTPRSVNGLMNGKFTIGADAAAAAGPIGRQAAAATDARLQAEILSYSRSRGLFAGVSIDGSILQLDHLAGSNYYHGPVASSTGQLIQRREELPPTAMQLMSRVDRYSGSSGTLGPVDIGPLAPRNQPASQSDLARRRLVDSWNQLAGVLDRSWRQYLSLPSGVVSGEAPSVESLRGVLERYAAVAADPRYRVLTATSQFATTHQLLQAYVALHDTQPTSKLALPPPPTRY